MKEPEYAICPTCNGRGVSKHVNVDGKCGVCKGEGEILASTKHVFDLLSEVCLEMDSRPTTPDQQEGEE